MNPAAATVLLLLLCWGGEEVYVVGSYLYKH